MKLKDINKKYKNDKNDYKKTEEEKIYGNIPYLELKKKQQKI